MKTFSNLVLTTLLLVMSVGVVCAKEVYKINTKWEFAKGGSLDKQAVALPHYFDSELLRSGEYFRTLDVPESWVDKRIVIKFNGVGKDATLFVNGRFVGEHKGANTAFSFDISPFIHVGSNSVALNVTNFDGYTTLPLTSEQYGYGGIYRDVELLVSEKGMIQDLDYGSDGVVVVQNSVTDKKAKLDIISSIVGVSGEVYGVNCAIFDGDNLVVKGGTELNIGYDGKAEAVVSLEIDNPILWAGQNNPHQYRVVVSLLSADGMIVDSESSKFGVKYYDIDSENGFMLNSEPYPLYGVLYTDDRFGCGLSNYEIEQDIKRILEVGATAVRTTPAPLNPYFYELCDKYGILVWCDFPFVGDSETGIGYVNNFGLMSNGEKQLYEMLNQYNNHPSIFTYGVFNKVTTKGDNPISFIDRVNQIIKRFSPDKLTIATSVENGKINYITDLIAWGQYFGWRNDNISDFKIWVDGFNSNWSELSPAIAEYGAEAKISHTYSDITPRESGVFYTEEQQNIFHEAYLEVLMGKTRFWSYFVNSMFDYRSSSKSVGGGADYSYYGLVSYDRATPKDAFYLYKANWNRDDKFVHIANSRKDYGTGATTVTVYSNCDLVELKVEGVSLGISKVVDGVAKYPNVKLDNEVNSIEVIGDSKYIDNAFFSIKNNL